MAASMNADTFLNRSKSKHGSKFDYKYTAFSDTRTPLAFRCIEHDTVFFSAVRNHLASETGGCHVCAAVGKGKASKKGRRGGVRLTRDEVLKRLRTLFGNKYTYSRLGFTRVLDCITVTCRKHGDFRATAAAVMQGHGCPDCGRDSTYHATRHTQATFLKKARMIHGTSLVFSKTEYRNQMQACIVTCRRHGDYETTPENVLSGQKCPQCARQKNSSIGEKYIAAILENLSIPYRSEYKDKRCRNKNLLIFDFAIFDKSFKSLLGLIEFHGSQHFKGNHRWAFADEYERVKETDHIKRVFVKRYAVPLLIVTDNNKSNDIIMDFLKNIGAERGTQYRRV